MNRRKWNRKTSVAILPPARRTRSLPKGTVLDKGIFDDFEGFQPGFRCSGPGDRRRVACDPLQAELAPLSDFARYFVER